MKKNKMMRFASLLLVAVLATTCAISGTFAKYTTSTTGDDSARVAAFGVEVETEGTLFAKSYTAPDNENTITVQSSTEMNVIAPGTSGEISSVSITGQPEVAVEVAISSATVSVTGSWVDKDGNFYFPLVFTVAGDTVDLSNCSSNDEVAAALQAALAGDDAATSQTYSANTNLNEQEVTAVDVSWEWAFDDADNPGANDLADTALGDAAATALAGTDGESAAPAISIDFGISVTQID